MNLPNDFTEIVNGKRYSIKSATLIADDAAWNGRSHEVNFRNRFLFLTKNGAFFMLRLTQWQGEEDRIFPLDKAEAKDLLFDLPQKHLSWEQLEQMFGFEIEDA